MKGYGPGRPFLSGTIFNIEKWLQTVSDWIESRVGILNATTSQLVRNDIYYVRADSTAGDITITLPLALTRGGRQITIEKISSDDNTVTVGILGSDTINGSSTQSISVQYDFLTVISNGNAVWEIISKLISVAFLAYNSATDTNVTGNGTFATVDFDTEVFDRGGNFASDTFTAPVTGRYRFSASVRAQQLTNATSVNLRLATSNRNYLLHYYDAAAIAGNADILFGGSVLADMDAGDTALIQLAVTGIGADTADIWGTTAPQTYFSGEFVN